MHSAFPEPVLTITPAAVRDLQGREALSGLWTLFTKCKESLQDGRRLENISWRLWYREIMRDGASATPSLSRAASSSSFCEEKAEKEKQTDSEKGGEKQIEKNNDESHSIPPPSAATFTRTPGLQHPAPIPTPQSPPPTYVFGFDFGSKDQDDRIREQGSNTVSRMNYAHPLTPSASQTSMDTDSEASQVKQDVVVPALAPSSTLRAPSIPQPSTESKLSSSALTEPSIPVAHSQSRSIDKRPNLFTTSTSSTNSVLSATSAASVSTSPNSKPRHPYHRRRRSSFVNGTEEEPVNVGLIICEMLPSAGLESSDKAPMHIPFPSTSLSRSSRVTSPASSLAASNLQNTPTLSVSISDVNQQYHGSSSSTPTTTATMVGVGLAFADLAKSAASTLPTPEIEIDEEDTLPAPPRVGGARYPLIVPSPQTSPPRPQPHHQQQQSQSASWQGTPPVIPPIIASGGVQPPQLVIVTPTPGATPHPTPPATPLVGLGIGGRMYGQYLIVPKSSSQGRSKTRGGDGEREDGDEEDSAEEDEDEEDDDYTDSEDGDYEDEEEEERVTAKAVVISDIPTATRSTASPPPTHTGLAYGAIVGGDSEKRVSISSAISDRSTTSNTSSNTTHTTSSTETRDTEASLQPVESRRDKGKKKDLTPPDDEWEEEYEDEDGKEDEDGEEDEYHLRGHGELDDEDAIMEEVEAVYERSLQRGYPEAMASEHEPPAVGSDGASSMATMKADVAKLDSHSSSDQQQDRQKKQLEQQQPQVQPSKPLLSAHTKKRSPIITSRSTKNMRGGFTAGKGKSMSRSHSRNRDEVLKLAGALVMTASAAIVSSPPQEPELVAVVKSSPVVATPTPVVASPPAKALPPPLPTMSAAVAPPGSQMAISPPPPSPTYSIQSASSSGRGRSRNIVAIGRGVGGNGGKGKRRGGHRVAPKRRLSGDARKSSKDDNGEEEDEEEAGQIGEVPDTREGDKETFIEMDAHDMLDEEVNPQAKVEQSDAAAAMQQRNPNTDNQSTVGPIDPAQVEAHIVAQIQAENPPLAELVPTIEHRAPVRFNIGSNSEDGTGSASASGSASVGRSGSTGFRSGSGSGSRTRGGLLKKRLGKAKARAVSRSVEEEGETAEEFGRKSGETGGHAETHGVGVIQQAHVQPAQAQPAPRVPEAQQPMQAVVRPLLQPMGNRKGGRQLEELLKMEPRTHQLASRQVSAVAVGSGLPPVIAPLAPSPRPNGRSPSQGRGKSPRTKSVIAQRASTSRSSGSTSKNLQDPQLMKVLNHVMDLPSNGNRQKKVVLATSESEEDDDDDYETETDVDEAGLVAALSPHQQRAFADHVAATQAAPEVVQDQQHNDDEEWSSATDEIDDDVSPPSQARPQASPNPQRTSPQPPVRPPAVQRTYSSHYPAGRTGRAVKQQLVEQQRQQQQHLLQQQQQQNQRRIKPQRDTLEINRLPSESFQNLALAKLRNNSIGGLTRLLNPGLNEHELLSTVRRGYSSGDILKDSPMRRVSTGGTFGGMHGLRPLTSANPSLAPMPLMQPPFAPMVAPPPPNRSQVVDPRVQMNITHQDQDYMMGRPPLVRRHTEHGLGLDANTVQPVETCDPAPNMVPTPVAALAPVVSGVPTAAPVSPVVAPGISKGRSAIRPQPHHRQSSSSSMATALRPNGLLTKLTRNKSFIAPASTTVTVNSLASDRASPAEINPKNANSLYSKVPPDATSRIRALNALVNSRKPTPLAKSPPPASPIATSSSAPADAVMAAAAPQQDSLSPLPAPPAPATVHESVTAPNGANVAVGLNGYGGAGRYQSKGPPPDVELETEEEDEDGMYEHESSEHTDSVAEGTFLTERQKQIAASLACSLSADPVLDDPAPPKPSVNSKGKGEKVSIQERVRKVSQAQVQRSAQGKVGTGGRRGGKSAERLKGVRNSSANVVGDVAEPEIAQQQVAPAGGTVASGGEGSQQRRLPKALQFTQIAPSEQAPTRQASRQALQQEQNQQHPVQYPQDQARGYPQQQQFQPGPRQPFHQQPEYMQQQQQQQHVQLQHQLQQLEQQQIRRQVQQQQQLQHHQQQQFLQNTQQQFAYQPQGQDQLGYPRQQYPQHPPHFYPQGGPSNHANYAPIPYTQSHQHFPTASLQQLGFPYNLPVTAIPSTPRTTRRTMVKDELSESVRQGVVIGRKITKLNPGLNHGRRTSMGEDTEWRRPLTAAPSMVQLLPKGTLKAMGVEDDEPGASRGKGPMAEPDPAMRRALQHSRNKSWADTTHTSGW